MSQEAARTPGATRAGDGEYLFDLAKVNHILGGPDYSTANGACVEGDRMIVGLMRMPAGTGAEPHSHPNEQWIYILQGTFRAKNVTDTLKNADCDLLDPALYALIRHHAENRFRFFHSWDFQGRNHFRNMSSVSIISVKPARRSFTVETIAGTARRSSPKPSTESAYWNDRPTKGSSGC